MQTITHNPYRTLGVLAGASTKEITRQTTNLKRYIAADVEPPADFSFSALDNFVRTAEDIDTASARLSLDSDKMLAALFWFWKGNEITDEPAFDEPAFDALKDGDIKTAYQIWDKLTVTVNEKNKRCWNDVSAKNASAFHNSTVLVLFDNTLGAYVSAVMANIKFIESDFFSDFVKSTVDVTYKVSKKDIELSFLEVIVNEINDNKIQTSLSKLVNYLNDYDFAAKADFLKSISQKFTANITAQIETARKQRSTNKANAATAGKNLYKNTKGDLAQLKSIFGEQNFSYSSAADKVANEILQCSIDFFNESQKKELDNDYYNKTLTLAKEAQSIAVGSLIKERINESLETLEEMQFKAIQVLKAIKQIYDTCLWNQTVNESKVIEIIQQTITRQDVNEIKSSTNQSKIEEYKMLANFVLRQLGTYYKAKVSYLDWWSMVTNQTNTKNTSTNSSSSSDNWMRWLFGISTILGIIIGAFNGCWWFGGLIGFVVSLMIVGWISDEIKRKI
jgi:hypothetical protein